MAEPMMPAGAPPMPMGGDMPMDAGAMPPGPPVEGGGPEIPPPPPGGYSKSSVNDLVDALQAALKAVGKAIKKEMPEVPDVPAEAFAKGKLEMELPPWLAEELVTILGVASQVGGKQEGRYDLDVMAMLADDAGLDKLAIALELLARDKVLLDKMRQIAREGPGPAPAKKPVAKEEEVVEVTEEKPGTGAAFL